MGRGLASASVFAGEGVLISRDSMICRNCRKKGKKQRKRAKKMYENKGCETLYSLNKLWGKPQIEVSGNSRIEPFLYSPSGGAVVAALHEAP